MGKSPELSSAEEKIEAFIELLKVANIQPANSALLAGLYFVFGEGPFKWEDYVSIAREYHSKISQLPNLNKLVDMWLELIDNKIGSRVVVC